MGLHAGSFALVGCVFALLVNSPPLQAQGSDQEELLAYRLTIENLEKYVQVFLSLHDAMRRGEPGPPGLPRPEQSEQNSVDVKTRVLMESGQAMLDAITSSGLPPREFVIIQQLLGERDIVSDYLSPYNNEFLKANRSLIESYLRRIDISMENLFRDMSSHEHTLSGTPSLDVPDPTVRKSSFETGRMHDLIIWRIKLIRDLTGTLALWEVQLSNRSRRISYRNIQYATSYYDSMNKLVSQRRGRFSGEVSPGAQHTFSINDGFYPQTTLRYTIELKSAEAYEVANQ